MVKRKRKTYGLLPLYERQLVWYCVNDSQMWGTVGVHLDEDLLDSPCARTIIGACKAIYAATGKGPSCTRHVAQRLKSLAGDGKITLVDLRAAFTYLADAEDEDLDPEVIIAEVSPILKKHIRTAALSKSVEELSRGADLTAVIEAEQKAAGVGKIDRSIGLVFGSAAFEQIARLSDTERMTTGLAELDDILAGGVVVTEPFSLIIGDTGSGKSHFLTQIGAEAIKRGCFVAMASLELSAELQHARMLAAVSGVPTTDIVTKGPKRDEAMRIGELFANSCGTFVVQDFPAHATLVSDIKEWVKLLREVKGGLPHLLLIDYLDLLVAKNAKDEITSSYVSGKSICTELRTWARKEGFFLWTASQTQRRKDRKRSVDSNDVADSMHKTRIADLVLTIKVTVDPDTKVSYVDIGVGKFRLAASGVYTGLIPTAFDRGCLIAPYSSYETGAQTGFRV